MHPRRPNGPTIDNDHEAYLVQVEIASGVVDDGGESEVVVVKQGQPRKWKQDSSLKGSPEKRPRRTYAEAAGPRESPTREQSGESQESQYEKVKGKKSIDQVAKEMDAETKARLIEQETKIDPA